VLEPARSGGNADTLVHHPLADVEVSVNPLLEVLVLCEALACETGAVRVSMLSWFPVHVCRFRGLFSNLFALFLPPCSQFPLHVPFICESERYSVVCIYEKYRGTKQKEAYVKPVDLFMPARIVETVGAKSARGDWMRRKRVAY
jgi:hypothetical protein